MCRPSATTNNPYAKNTFLNVRTVPFSRRTIVFRRRVVTVALVRGRIKRKSRATTEGVYYYGRP